MPFSSLLNAFSSPGTSGSAFAAARAADDAAAGDAPARLDVQADQLHFIVVVVDPWDVDRSSHWGGDLGFGFQNSARMRSTMACSSASWARSRLRAAAMGTGAVPMRTTLPVQPAS